MWKTVEQFCKDHEKTIEFCQAAFTLLAVIVSLGIARSARKATNTRLRVRLQTEVIKRDALSKYPTYVTISITNTGILPIRIPISYFQLKVPLRQENWIIEHSPNELLIPPKQFPVEILPHATEKFYPVEINSFRYTFHEIVRATGWGTRILFRFVKATVVTDDGMRFTAIVDGDIRRVLEECRKTAPTTIIGYVASQHRPETA
jgi:hypothetical protein